jgi:hypothetical protein
MSDTALPVFRRINNTPLRDVLRGRLTGRLAWKHRLAAARLPAPAAELIVRVVKRTRLFRLGKAAAADDLIAHFLDGLAAGTDAGEPVERLGDERLAARLMRGRITGRLDWKSSLAAAGLPAVAADLTTRVVRRTRLFRQEKAAVANELIAHFLDGMAAGSAVEELVEKFGDERATARLIRRAKLRGRSLTLRACGAGVRATAAVVAIYALLLLRFCISRTDAGRRLPCQVERADHANRAE